MRFLDLLTAADRRRLYLLLAGVAAVAALELGGVAAVLPFMRLLAEAEPPAGWPPVWVVGLGVIGLVALTRLLGLWVLGYQQRFIWGFVRESSRRLLAYYVDRPYTFFLDRNAGDLQSTLTTELDRLADGYLNPLFHLITSAATALLLTLLLFLVDPLVAAVSALVLGLCYVLLFRFRRRELDRMGAARMAGNRERHRTLGELFRGIKTIKSFRAEPYFLDRYDAAVGEYTRWNPRTRIIGSSPRYLLDILAFGGIIGLTLLLYAREGGLGEALPVLTLFAVAGYRLLPALQNAFAALAELRSNAAVIDGLYPDLTAALAYVSPPEPPATGLTFESAIRWEGLRFSFPNSAREIISDQGGELRRGEIVALAGKTGVGKTTLADLLTGLLRPTAGIITVDGALLTPHNTPAWRSLVAYVQQEAFLIDASFLRNLLLGPGGGYNENFLKECVEAAALTEVVAELPKGMHTRLGDRGVRLSGGQRQRIGICRALLRRPRLLVLDEATSALDLETESRVLDALRRLPDAPAVLLIAHRPETLAYADRRIDLGTTRPPQ